MRATRSDGRDGALDRADLFEPHVRSRSLRIVLQRPTWGVGTDIDRDRAGGGLCDDRSARARRRASVWSGSISDLMFVRALANKVRRRPAPFTSSGGRM